MCSASTLELSSRLSISWDSLAERGEGNKDVTSFSEMAVESSLSLRIFDSKARQARWSGATSLRASSCDSSS